MKKFFTGRISITFLILIVLTIDTCLLLWTKYSINGLGIEYFRFWSIGNFIQIILFFVSVIGVIVKRIVYKSQNGLFKFALAISFVILVLNLVSIILMNSELFGAEEYLLGFPANKFILSLVVISRTFIQTYFIAFIWMTVFRDDVWNTLRAVISSVIMIILMNAFSFLYIQNDLKSAEPGDEKFKTAIVLGAAVYKNNKPSPLFEARIKKAFELYSDSTIKKIIVTGSNAPGEITEAEAAYELLISLGVKNQDIEIENQSRTTIEQIRFLRERYYAENNHNDIVIISDKFHLSRISEICKFFDIRSQNVSSNYDMGDEKLLFYRARESISLLIFWLNGI